MLDERCIGLLRFIVKECSDGSFRVIDIDDLIVAIPKKFKPDNTSVNICMEYLQKSGFVLVKYKDNKNYCLMPLPKSYEMIESENNKKQNDKKLIKFGILGYFLVLLFAFLGSFLANIIISLF